jgi:hypothetical protein
MTSEKRAVGRPEYLEGYRKISIQGTLKEKVLLLFRSKFEGTLTPPPPPPSDGPEKPSLLRTLQVCQHLSFDNIAFTM